MQEHDRRAAPGLFAGEHDVVLSTLVAKSMRTILASVPIDATDATFERDVLQRSHEQTVVVDFWAEWCGPCRQLTPVLEKAVAKRGDQMELVKVDTDANPMVSQAFRIQSSRRSRRSRTARSWTSSSARSRPRRSSVPRRAGPVGGRRAGRVRQRGRPAARAGARAGRADATVALARLVNREEALKLLANVAGSFAADGLAARIRLEDDAELRKAFAAIDEGEYELGVDALIAAIPASEGDRREDLRRAVVGVLDELGVEHPVARSTPQARRRAVLIWRSCLSSVRGDRGRLPGRWR